MSSIFPLEENLDLFDRLPDGILLTIFDKVQDAKSLSISLTLCKRFHSLITQTQNISLAIPPQKHNKKSSPTLGFLNRVLLRPFQFLFRQVTKLCTPVSKNNCKCCTCTYASPAEILKSFNDIKQLEILLPSPKNDNIGSGESLLKWKAEFGSQLKNCVIVGGTSLSPTEKYHIEAEKVENLDSTQHCDDSLRITNEELKLRIVWTISCLIAASSRHCLLEETVKEKETLENVVIRDDIGQGKCCMNNEQVQEMRRNSTVISSKVPALKVKMWFMPELELPEEGCVVKGATLVVIRPAEEADDGGDLVAKGFGEGKEEKVFDGVARELVKLNRNYSLEMNSF